MMFRTIKLLHPDYVRGRIDLTSLQGLKLSLRSLVFLKKNLTNLRKGHLAFISKLVGVKIHYLEQYLAELNRNTSFFESLEQQYLSVWPSHRFYPHFFETNYPSKGGSVFFQSVTMYLLVRAMRPNVVIETGGAGGKSSTFILQALKDNQQGRLVTLDLNPEATGRLNSEYSWWPQGQPSYFLVPDNLRNRLDIRLGDAKTNLPKLLEEIDSFDLFRHDSDHSYEHMLFEFRAAWPMLRDGGILVSDDIRANTSFYEFCQEVDREPVVSLQALGGIQK
ncbi:class I SAM-dependent methyltransferase [Anaerolineales bacterium HSG24]|nr:class I SAM-dependent methyltransferase [Anaerolineales bacterium HSG24]